MTQDNKFRFGQGGATDSVASTKPAWEESKVQVPQKKLSKSVYDPTHRKERDGWGTEFRAKRSKNANKAAKLCPIHRGSFAMSGITERSADFIRNGSEN
jgi:hypothetical protein